MISIFAIYEKTMWFKLNESDGTCFGLNREIAYAYLILKEYLANGREKCASSSPSAKNKYLKKLYKSLRNENHFEEQV